MDGVTTRFQVSRLAQIRRFSMAGPHRTVLPGTHFTCRAGRDKGQTLIHWL